MKAEQLELHNPGSCQVITKLKKDVFISRAIQQFPHFFDLRGIWEEAKREAERSLDLEHIEDMSNLTEIEVVVDPPLSVEARQKYKRKNKKSFTARSYNAPMSSK